MAGRRPALIALAAAALFGASVPLAHRLLGSGAFPQQAPWSPFLLAGLLYLGAGAGLLLLRLARRALAGPPAGRQATLPLVPLPPRGQRRDLAAAILCGGVLAPVLLLAGLGGTGAASASLLLNAEAVCTAWLAARFFGEPVGARTWAATLLVLAGGAALGWGEGQWQPTWQAAVILLACLLWGLDNNFTRRVADGDALAIALLKGLAAGSWNVLLALALGAHWPAWPQLAVALLLGAASYGASLALYVVALRHLGSARTAAWFAGAPFCGALLAVLLGEPVTAGLPAALLLMAGAAWLLAGERHAHRHVHAPLRHRHAHAHAGADDDAHHRHAHAPGEAVAGAAAHEHEHEHGHLEHAHEHAPDLHHRHPHH